MDETGEPDIMAQAREALGDVVPRLVSLVRSVPDASAASVGSWTVGEVAAHVSQAFRLDIDVLNGRTAPKATVTTAGMDEFTAKMLAEDGERDPATLADRIAALAKEFDEAASRSRAAAVDWLQGASLPPSAVVCHLLQECLVHGLDIARATGNPWPIQRDHGRLAFEGFGQKLVAALPPTALVNQEKAGSFRARFDLRVRGGERKTLVFDDGSMSFEAPATGDVDAHISANPVALMLILFGRQGVAKPILTGNLTAWGPRPWKIPQMLAAISLP